MEDGIEQYMSTFLQNYKEKPRNPNLGKVSGIENEINESLIEYPPYYCKSQFVLPNQISKETKKKKKLLWKQIGKNMEDKNKNSDEIQWMTFTTTFAIKKDAFIDKKQFDLNSSCKFLLEKYLDQELGSSVFKECSLKSINGFTYDNWWNGQHKIQIKNTTNDLYNLDTNSSDE